MFSSCYSNNEKDKDNIEQLWHQYRSAVISNDGKSIPSLVDLDTLSHYQRLIKDAATLDKAELDNRNILAKLIILRLRHDYDKRELEQLKAGELLSNAVEKGLISQVSVSNIQKLVNIKVKGDIAVASTQDQPEIPVFHFSKQEGSWRLSLWKSFGDGVNALESFKKRLNKNDYELIKLLYEKASHKKFNDMTLMGPIKQM